MSKTLSTIHIVSAAFAFLCLSFAFAPSAQATTYYYTGNNSSYVESLVAQINALLRQLERAQSTRQTYTRYDYSDYGYNDRYNYPLHIRPKGDSRSSHRSSDDDIPEVTTEEADDVDEDSARLEGDIEMNDYENGIAFFVYGEDEDEIEDVEDEDEYRDVRSRGDDIQKILLTSNLDDDRRFTARVNGLDDDTDYYFRICVEYDDEDDDETLVCGDVEDFTTDED
jgi:hypothetical protein